MMWLHTGSWGRLESTLATIDLTITPVPTESQQKVKKKKKSCHLMLQFKRTGRVTGRNDPLNQLTASLLSLGWPFGSLVCKMSGMVQGISVSASVFTLVAIAVDRYSGWICTNAAASCNTTPPLPSTSYSLLKMCQRDIVFPLSALAKTTMARSLLGQMDRAF